MRELGSLEKGLKTPQRRPALLYTYLRSTSRVPERDAFFPCWPALFSFSFSSRYPLSCSILPPLSVQVFSLDLVLYYNRCEMITDRDTARCILLLFFVVVRTEETLARACAREDDRGVVVTGKKFTVLKSREKLLCPDGSRGG